MNERGYFTIVGLCLLLVVVFSIRAIQDTEKNYSYVATNFQSEIELQNVADSALVETVEKIRSGEIIVAPPTAVEIMMNRKYWQRKISVNQIGDSDRLKNISVEVYGERGKIAMYTRNYSYEDDYSGTRSPYKDKPYKKIYSNQLENDTDNGGSEWQGVILISVASGENNSGEKKFRRALAYVLDDEHASADEKFIIHFMNDAERGSLKTN